MKSDLESPAGPEDLYLAREDEVTRLRPIMTGDVFEDIEILGLDEDPGLAVIITHPCAMRVDGVHLVNRLLVAAVRESSTPPHDWGRGLSFRVMPLPALHPSTGVSFAARFEDVGLVSSSKLQGAARVACLSVRGVNLLQQRLINHLTRLVVPTHLLHKACSYVFDEAELLEEWLETARRSSVDLDEARRSVP